MTDGWPTMAEPMVPDGTTHVAVVDLENLLAVLRGPTVEDSVARVSAVLDEVLGEGTYRVGAAVVRDEDRFEDVRLDVRLAADDVPDAADRELLRVLRHLPESVTHVVICSGDARFAHRARQVARAGTDVTVVASEGALAPALARAATRVVHL